MIIDVDANDFCPDDCPFCKIDENRACKNQAVCEHAYWIAANEYDHDYCFSCKYRKAKTEKARVNDLGELERYSCFYCALHNCHVKISDFCSFYEKELTENS